MDNSPETPPNSADLVGAELAESAELEAGLAALRERHMVSADVPVGAALAEFVDVVDLTSPSNQERRTPTTRRNKMLTGLGAFVATTTGKIVLGTTVAAASVGGMHAAEVVDVPLLPDQATAEVLMIDEDANDTESAAIAETDTGQADVEEAAVEDDGAAPDELGVADSQIDESSDNAETDLPENEDADDENEDETANHGSVVSEFARTTELEGCERGQAVAELARSKPKKNESDTTDGETDGDDTEDDGADVEGDADADESKCQGDDSEESQDDDVDENENENDDDDDDEEGDDDDGEGPPDGKGHNRDDHPGQGNAGGNN